MTDKKIENWQENTNNELSQYKEEIINHIVEEMRKEDPSITFVWKKSISKYLLDDRKNSFRNFLTWIGINIFSSSSKKLKELREKIKNIDTKEELKTLEESIINNIAESQKNKTSSWSTSSTPVQTTTSNPSTESETFQPKESSKENVETVVGSAKVWEAVNIKKEERMKRLFPSWAPKSKEEMQKYLKTIDIPVRTPDWKEDKLKLIIHVKLAEEYKAIFQEMYNKNIPVNPKKSWWFCWRKMRKGSKMSHHSYWTAVDVNYDVNGWVYGKTDRNSPYFNNQTMVNIWKQHGFYRWWDRSKNYNDPMHFTYMGW